MGSSYVFVAGRVQWHRAFGHTGPAGRCLLLVRPRGSLPTRTRPGEASTST